MYERNTLQCKRGRSGPTGNLVAIKRMSPREINEIHLDQTILWTDFLQSRSIINAVHNYNHSASKYLQGCKDDKKYLGCNLSLKKIICSWYLSQINFLTPKSQGKSIAQN